MLSQRREQIRELLTTRPFVGLEELQALFPSVSTMTLRRDIDYLERCGDAIKVRGGARSMKFITTSMEDNFASRMHANPATKERLAAAALPLIETGRSIFLDSGTTMMYLAQKLPDARLTVTTTGPNIALELVKKSQPIVNIVGGMLNRDNITVCGNQAQRFLEDINIDIAFLVPSGASAENGLTCGNFIECDTKRLVVQKAHRNVLLLESAKLDRSLPYTFAKFEEMDVIITDAPLPMALAERAARADVKIIIAN